VRKQYKIVLPLAILLVVGYMPIIKSQNILESTNIIEILNKIKPYSGLGGVYDDTAQKLVYKARELNEKVRNDTIDYYLQNFQTEMFYYAGLYQFGIHSAELQIEKSRKIKDSFLIGSAYFFKAINLLELDSFKLTKAYLDTAIIYYPLRKPSVLYRKLAYHNQIINVYAENCFEQKDYRSALLFNNLALAEAYAENSLRGIPAGHLVQGKIFYELGNLDSAKFHFIKTIEKSISFKHKDLQLAGYGKLLLLNTANKSLVKDYLNKGLYLIEKETINNAFKVFFYKDAITVCKNNNDLIAVEQLQNKLLELKDSDNKMGNELVQNITNQMLLNEKKILGLQVKEAQQKQQLANTRLLMTLFGVVFLSIAFLVYRYFQRQKQKVYTIRQNISKDLHDDIGASLSSLQIYSTVAENSLKENPEKASEMLQKISHQSKQAMENMNDIVWSMNTNEANALSLEAKIKNYSVELLSNNNIELNCKVDATVEKNLKNITAKRNILLIIREALNNISKYSKASKASLVIRLHNNCLMLTISDNGIGFDGHNSKKGNGMGNMQKRAQELGGSFVLTTAEKEGTILNINIPLKSL
jgi:signal transduction histidine kinase